MEYKLTDNLPSIHFEPNRLPVTTKWILPCFYLTRLLMIHPLGSIRMMNIEIGIHLLSQPLTTGFLKLKSMNLRNSVSEETEMHRGLAELKFQKIQPAIRVVHVPAVDRDSGIDYKRSMIEVNGEPGIIEYDKDKDLLIYYNPEFLLIKVKIM